MIPPLQFLEHVIHPTLEHLAHVEKWMAGPASEQLMLGTALAESTLTHLVQIGGGPARSMFQIEVAFNFDDPLTFEDIYERYLRSRPRLLVAIHELRMPAFTPYEQITGNQHFACGIARLRYWMVPERLPMLDDLAAMGRYYKKYFNTAGGLGEASHWADLYRHFVQ